MSTPVLIIGKSGTGKSRSIVNLDPVSTFVISAIPKDLPFRGWKKKYTPLTKTTGNWLCTDDYTATEKAMKYIDKELPKIKVLVIDDFQYFMADEFMRRAHEKGYDKFTEIGEHAWNLIWNLRMLRGDLVCFLLAHSDQNDLGETKCKTIGKLLDEKICVEGMFSIVLNTLVDNGQYFFQTQNNGANTTKSPEGMFATERIPNDLSIVVSAINKYNTEE